MNLEETLAASRKLDRLLSGQAERAMPDLGGKGLVGDVGGMLAQVRRSVEEAKAGLMGAVAEFIGEVEGLKHVEAAVREETKAVRDLKTSILGNAVGGEGGQG